MKRQLTPYELAYLSDDWSFDVDKDFSGFTLWCYRHGMEGCSWDAKPEDLWREYRDEFLPEFISRNPGRRPLAWWQWDAPRQPDHGSGCSFEGTLPEPRKRIGGKGELHEGYVPAYQFGFPQHWDSKTLDPDDPLIFESQTAYLIRHELLSAQEKKYLASHPELMEPEMIIIE
jgi:hypothetical protein